MEIFAIISLGITMSLIPNLLEGKKINIKLPKLIKSLIFLTLSLFSMIILFFGYYYLNILFIILGLVIYSFVILII